MKFVLRNAMLLAAVIMLFGFDIARSVQTGSVLAGPIPRLKKGHAQKRDEIAAAAALTKLGVPLQHDSKGVVRWIEAAEAEFNDEAMQYLPSLYGLEWLEIGGGSVTPSGMKRLKDCPALRRLYVYDINLSGDALEWLSNLAELEALSLQRTGIDGRVLKNLTARDTLTVLNLSGDKIDNGDMDQIARIKKLEVLALADTKVTSIGIAKLEDMPNLNELNLMRCSILDGDLEYFLSMPNLRIVYAEGCNLSDMAVMDIAVRFPMLAIFR